MAAAPSSSSVGFLIMKLGTNNRSCSSHFDIYLFADARVHSTQLYERERERQDVAWQLFASDEKSTKVKENAFYIECLA